MKTSKFILILLLSIIVFLPGTFSVFDKDEPKYMEAAYEMVETGDYITPHYNYKLRFDKPILVYWLITAGYKVFGVNEFGGRFFISLFGIFTAILTFWWLRRWKGEDFAFFSSLILISSLDFLIMSSIAMPDIILTFFITSSLIAFYQGYRTEKNFYYLLAFASAGFATLTKGPVGIVLPGLIAVIYLSLRRDLTATFRKIPWIWGISIFTIVIAPWYLLVLKKHGYLFFKEFIIFHNIKRFLSKVPGHPTQWYYYLANFPWVYFPWSIFFPFAIWHLMKRERHHTITDDILHFSLIWFFTVFLFFQIAHTKLAHYLLPSFPAFSVIVAWYMLKYKEKIPKFLLIMVSFILSLLLAILVNLKGLPMYIPAITIPFLLSTILSLKYDAVKSVSPGFIATLLLLKYFVLPSVEPFRAKPTAGKIARTIAENCRECKFYFLNYSSPEIVYYFRSGKLEDLKPKEIEKLLNSNSPVFVITRENRLNRIKGVNYSLVFRKPELITKHKIVIITNRKGEDIWKRLQVYQ